MRLHAAVLITVLAMAGCTARENPGLPDAPASVEPSPMAAPSLAPQARPTTLPRSSTPPPSIVESARADLASRLGIPLDEVSVVQVESTDWPDTSLGCPQPGKGYAQVVTPGARIELQAGGQIYSYHTDLATHLVFCSVAVGQGLPTLPVIPGEIDDGQPWMPVD